jgi:Cd(II)/Pb(II)-responsive transcriptional regulator
MKIGELAKATGTPVETIRYYEHESLLPDAARTASNYRTYEERHVRRLAFIRHCRCLDMTLDEIRLLLRYTDAPGEDCGPVDQLLDAHIEHVVTRIKELKALERELRELRRCCDAPGTQCGILGGLERGAREHDHAGGGAGRTHHLPGTHRQSPAKKTVRR